nr:MULTISPECIES: hypothetical protein [unclassified Moraxella]
MNQIIHSKFCLLLGLFITQIVGCALVPQTYDSPIPVYVDLGDAIPATTLPNSKANAKTMSH